jgi:hypothetical protein
VLESAPPDPVPAATSATEPKRTASAVVAGRVRLRTMVSNPPERKKNEAPDTDRKRVRR